MPSETNDNDLANKILQYADSLSDDYGTLIQRKLLACEVIQEIRTLSITKRCQLAGCSRDSYYNAMRDETFIDNLIKLAKLMKVKYLMPVMNAFIDNLIHGGPKGYGDIQGQLRFLSDIGIVDAEQGTTKLQLELIDSTRKDRLAQGAEQLGYNVPEAIEPESIETIDDESGARGSGFEESDA